MRAGNGILLYEFFISVYYFTLNALSLFPFRLCIFSTARYWKLAVHLGFARAVLCFVSQVLFLFFAHLVLWMGCRPRLYQFRGIFNVSSEVERCFYKWFPFAHFCVSIMENKQQHHLNLQLANDYRIFSKVWH